MVLSLNDLCLLNVCNRIMDGILPDNMQIISPLVRRKIFKILVDRRQLNDATCLKYMKELLSDGCVCSIDMIQRSTEDWYHLERGQPHLFLQFLDAYSQESPDFCQHITTLRLVLTTEKDEHDVAESDDSHQNALSIDLGIALRLISRCRNLKHLTLMSPFIQSCSTSRSYLEILADAVQQSGSTGLESLELNYICEAYEDFPLTSDQELAFRRLKHLRFENSSLTGTSWSRLLDCCHDSLESLVLDKFTAIGGDLIPKRLESLVYLSRNWCQPPLNLSDTTERCPALRSCHIDFVPLHGDDISSLKQFLSAHHECTISIEIDHKTHRFLNELIDAAAGKLTSITLRSANTWVEGDIDEMIYDHPNLSAQEIGAMFPDVDPDVENSIDLLLCHQEWAENLIQFWAYTALTQKTLDHLFRNCTRLRALYLISVSDEVTDEHIETWTRNGARPTLVHLESSRITGYGVNLLLSSSSSNLKRLSIADCQIVDVDSVVETMIRCCPNLEQVYITGVNDRLTECHDRIKRNFFCDLSVEHF